VRTLRVFVLVGGAHILRGAGVAAIVARAVRVAVTAARAAVATVFAGLSRGYVAIVPVGLLALRLANGAAERQGQACSQRPAY